MEGIYSGRDKVIDFEEFLAQYQYRINEIFEVIPKPSSSDSISLDLLSHYDDVPVDYGDLPNRSRCEKQSFSVPKKARSLKCVEERIKSWNQKTKPKADTKFRTGIYCPPRSKQKEKKGGEDAGDEEEDEAVELDKIDSYSDLLITIRVLEPFKYDPYTPRKNLPVDYEIVVLGQTFLHDFRDLIKCPCDTAGPFIDISANPNVDVRAGDKYAGKTNSGFLFIGDTFYNDTRNSRNADHSEEILAWAEQHPEVGEFKRALMQEMQFIQLKGIRFGFPYVYQHFGACEHVLYFTDVRVISPADNRIRSDYPYLHLLKNARNIICEICGLQEAIHTVTGSSQHIFDPVNLCGKCLSSYHYVDGKKLGEFSAYRFR